jgi:hypothetical protein
MSAVYICPRCGNRVELYFTPTHPPVCDCRPGRAVTVMVARQKVDA